MPTLALVTVCAFATCALPSLAAERHLPTKLTPTTIKLKESSSTIKYDEEYSLSVTVSPSKATGTVIFYWRPVPGSGWDELASLPLVHGAAGGTRKFNKVGTFEIEAVFQGSKTYEKSTSNVVKVTSTK
jgi:hypothetical protein